MKKVFSALIFISLFLFVTPQIAKACHAIALVNTSITVLPTGVNCFASSDSPTCGCGNYWLDIEVQCAGCPFQGGCIVTNNYGPFITSGAGCYGSTQMAKPNCVVQAYPVVFIPFAGLCPGVTYKLQMREHHGTASPPVGPWSATYTFTTPGSPPVVTSFATATPPIICLPQTSQLNCGYTVNPSCSVSNCPITYSWVPASSLTNPLTQTPVAHPTATTTYTVYFLGGCVPVPPATVTVTVSASPIAGTASVNPTSVCSGSCVTLTLTGNSGTIQWQSGPSSSGPWTNIAGATTASYLFCPVTANIFFQAVVTNSCGSISSNVVSVTINPALVVTINPNPAAICVGGNVVLTATGAATYAWAPATGLSCTTCANPTASPTTTTTYTVTGTTGGCNGTATVTVTVNPLPVVVINPNPTAICAGSNVVLTASGATSFVWTPATGLSCTTCANPTANPTTTTTYTVTGTNAGGCSATATVTVTVNPMPTVTIVPNNPTICPSGSVVITASGASTYVWAPATGLSCTTCANPNASPTATTTYTVTGTGPGGCTGTATVTVTVANNFSVTATPNDTICFGANIPLTCTAGASYAWTPTASLSCSTCQNPVASPTATTTYSITVTSSSGCTGTATVTITVSPQINLAIAGFPETCTGACDGQAVVIPSGGIGGPFFLWSPGNGTGASINNICAGNYTVVVTDVIGCSATATTNVPAAPAIVLTQSVTTAHCNLPDGSATVNASGGTGSGWTYSWTCIPSQSTATASNLTPGNYCCYVHDGNNCLDTICVTVPNASGVAASITSSTMPSCFGGTNGTANANAVGGVGPYQYAWSTFPVQTSSAATGLASGTYTCLVTDASGCTDTAIVVINQPTQVTVAPMAAQTICIGQCVTLTAVGAGGNPGYIYSWNVTNLNVCPVVTTTYTVVATDANGCTSAPQTVTITVNAALTVTASANIGICPGSNTALTAQASGGSGSGYGYSWAPGSGLSCTTCQNPIASPTVTTTYTVYASDNCGTPMAIDSVTVTVYPLPVVNVTADTNAGCAPLCINLTDQSTISTGSITGWAWTMTGANPASSSSQNPANVCYTTPGSYQVTLIVTSNNGCTAQVIAPYMVTAYPLPAADFTLTPQPTTILNPQICFTDVSIGGITDWSWDFGDPNYPNNSDTIQNPCHTYTDSGTYCVTLFVMNANNCTDSVVYCLRIDPDFVLYVPNAFTPDGNNMNDIFMAEGIGVDVNNFKMWIYDRWGNNIFFTEKWGKGWDGHANDGNEIAQEDVYVWKIQVLDIFGVKHSLNGHVAIVK